MPEDLKYLVESYRAGTITRREFMQRAMLWTVSATVVSSLLDSLSPALAHADQVDPNDPALISAEIKFTAADGATIGGYLSQLKGGGRRPAVVVIHQNRGLDDHIRDVARRLATAGYAALAPDLLSRQGGTSSFPNPNAAIEAIRKVDDDSSTKDLTGAVNYLKGQTYVRADRIGVTGFCWGGGRTLLFTTRSKDLAASVIYYGPIPPNLDDVKNISAPVLAHYGELDKPITSQVPRLEDAMKTNGKSFEYKVYAGSPHAFNDDTNAERYRADAAKEAWGRTLEFFKKHLQS